MVHGGMTLVKYLLFLFNFVFWLSGIGVIVLGAVVHFKYRQLVNFLGDDVLSAPIMLIVAGFIIAVLGFFGCCGAVRENYCMTMTFAVLLGVIFILELGAGIASYVLADDVEQILEERMVMGMRHYNSSSGRGVSLAWDRMQRMLGCCGADGYADWANATIFLWNKNVPDSCCRPARSAEACGEFVRTLAEVAANETVFTRGCVTQLKQWAVDNAALVGGVSTGVAFIQIIGLCFACCLSKSILKDYEEFYY